MSNIIAPYGSPLNTVVIGVEDMEKSLHFYRDLVGLSASEIEVWHGKKFEKFWHLPNGSKADACFCELPECNVGRVLLLDFKASSKKKIRPENTPRAYGLVNLNFYTDDIKKEIDFHEKYLRFIRPVGGLKRKRDVEYCWWRERR